MRHNQNIRNPDPETPERGFCQKWFYLNCSGFIPVPYHSSAEPGGTKKIDTNSITGVLATASRAVDLHSFLADPDQAGFLNADMNPALQKLSLCSHFLVNLF